MNPRLTSYKLCRAHRRILSTLAMIFPHCITWCGLFAVWPLSALFCSKIIWITSRWMLVASFAVPVPPAKFTCSLEQHLFPSPNTVSWVVCSTPRPAFMAVPQILGFAKLNARERQSWEVEHCHHKANTGCKSTRGVSRTSRTFHSKSPELGELEKIYMCEIATEPRYCNVLMWFTAAVKWCHFIQGVVELVFVSNHYTETQRLRLQKCLLKSRETVSLQVLLREIQLSHPVFEWSAASPNQVISSCHHWQWKWAVGTTSLSPPVWHSLPQCGRCGLPQRRIQSTSPPHAAWLRFWPRCCSSCCSNNTAAQHELKGRQIAGQTYLLQQWMQKGKKQ